MPLRTGAIPRHGRSCARDRLQLLDMQQERISASDRAAGAIRARQRQGRADDVPIQHQDRKAHVLQALRHSSVLRAALRSGQDRRQCALPRQYRSCRDLAETIRRQALGGSDGHARAVAMNALDGELRNGRHVMSVRVYYEDTDFSGIVYHATYLRFMERGRTNHLRLLGAGHRALFEEASAEAPGFAFVVRSMQIEFLKPARMDDVLEVVTAPEEVKGASITLKQRILRADELLVEAHVRVAFVCGGQARPIPKALRTGMQGGQDRVGGRGS